MAITTELTEGVTMRAGQMVAQTSAEMRLDREMHAVFCRMVDANGRVPSDAIYDIRRRQQHPWRIFARRIIECARAGVPLPVVLLLLRSLEQFARGVYAKYGHTPHSPSGATVLPFVPRESGEFQQAA